MFKNVKSESKKYFWVSMAVTVVALVFGIVWFAMQWKPLGLPSWIGMVIALVAAVVACVMIWRLDDKEKEALKAVAPKADEAEKTPAEQPVASEAKPASTQTATEEQKEAPAEVNPVVALRHSMEDLAWQKCQLVQLIVDAQKREYELNQEQQKQKKETDYFDSLPKYNP